MFKNSYNTFKYNEASAQKIISVIKEPDNDLEETRTRPIKLFLNYIYLI